MPGLQVLDWHSYPFLTDGLSSHEYRLLPALIPKLVSTDSSEQGDGAHGGVVRRLVEPQRHDHDF